MDDSFKTLLLSAKNRDTEAVRMLFEMYKPLLKSYSAVNGDLDEDLFQELCIVFLTCIQQFEI